MARQYFQQRLFGIHMKQFRERHDLSQFEMAVLVHCTNTHIARLEKGIFEDHKMFVILEICDLMGVDFRSYISEYQEKF